MEIDDNLERYPEMRFNLNEQVSDHISAAEECDMNSRTDLRASFFDDEDTDRETDDFLLQLVLSLYGSKGLTIKHCSEVVGHLKTISEKTVELCIKRISNCENIDEAQQALKQCPVIDFSDYSSEYKFTHKLTDMNLLQEPTKFTIANEVVEKHPGELENVEHLGVLMDIEFQITRFLEIDGVLECLLANQRNLENVAQGVYKNFMNGKSWKTISAKYVGKTLIPLFIYNDDFTVRTKNLNMISIL